MSSLNCLPNFKFNIFQKENQISFLDLTNNLGDYYDLFFNITIIILKISRLFK